MNTALNSGIMGERPDLMRRGGENEMVELSE